MKDEVKLKQGKKLIELIILFLVDYDAPLSEAGDLTEKFWALRKIFKQYNPSADDQG